MSPQPKGGGHIDFGADPFGIGVRLASFLCVIFFSDFLCFDMSLLLLTVTLRAYIISIAYCLFFHFHIGSLDERICQIISLMIKNATMVV